MGGGRKDLLHVSLATPLRPLTHPASLTTPGRSKTFCQIFYRNVTSSLRTPFEISALIWYKTVEKPANSLFRPIKNSF